MTISILVQEGIDPRSKNKEQRTAAVQRPKKIDLIWYLLLLLLLFSFYQLEKRSSGVVYIQIGVCWVVVNVILRQAAESFLLIGQPWHAQTVPMCGPLYILHLGNPVESSRVAKGMWTESGTVGRLRIVLPWAFNLNLSKSYEKLWNYKEEEKYPLN